MDGWMCPTHRPASPGYPVAVSQLGCVLFKMKYLKHHLRAAFFQPIWGALEHLFGIYTAHNPQDLTKESLATKEAFSNLMSSIWNWSGALEATDKGGHHCPAHSLDQLHENQWFQAGISGTASRESSWSKMDSLEHTLAVTVKPPCVLRTSHNVFHCILHTVPMTP